MFAFSEFLLLFMRGCLMVGDADRCKAFVFFFKKNIIVYTRVFDVGGCWQLSSSLVSVYTRV